MDNPTTQNDSTPAGVGIGTSILSTLRDTRVNCWSVMTLIEIGNYLSLVQSAYENRGGIEGQRDPLRTNTAIRIRKTMLHDLAKGAVLPPVVLGIIVASADFEKIGCLSGAEFHSMLQETPKEKISIIDGMQRTTALNELTDSRILRRQMRVEYWIATSTNSLIYRMLVLNTGQVPWNLRRQIEVVFQSMISEIESQTSMELLGVGEGRRRARSGQFKASDIIELFLVFGARKEKVDTKERLADEFTRLDFIEATASSNLTEMFYGVLHYLNSFDLKFGRFRAAEEDREQTGQRFTSGKDLFASQPACVGFIAATALQILGRPGVERTPEQQRSELDSIKSNADKLLARLDTMDADELRSFLDFATLNQLLTEKRAGKSVGDYEREFFLAAFRVLIEEKFGVDTMTPCWRAY